MPFTPSPHPDRAAASRRAVLTIAAGLSLGPLAFSLSPLHAQTMAAPTSAGTTPPIFVLNSLDATVSLIDPQTWTERQRVPVGKEPHHLYLTPDEKSVIVANSAGDSLSFFDPRTGALQRTVFNIIDP